MHDYGSSVRFDLNGIDKSYDDHCIFQLTEGNFLNSLTGYFLDYQMQFV